MRFEDTLSERWRPVPGWEGLYEVSDLGRVRRGSRILKPRPCSHGYHRAALHADSNRSDCKVHRLVLLAFVGPPPSGMEGCHNDGDPGNNRLSNLRWDTRSENLRDRTRHGVYCGEKHPAAKLSNDDARAILHDQRRVGVIAADYGVSSSTVSNLKAGRTWAWLH